MTRFTRAFAISLGLLGMVGCKSGDDDAAEPANQPATNSTCNITLSGALERTAACSAGWLQSSSSAINTPYFGATELDGSAGFGLFDQLPKLGRFDSGGAFNALGLAVDVPGVNQQEWRLYENSENGADTGSYSLAITGITDRGESNGFHLWDIDGSLDATFSPDEATGASGELELHMDF